MIIRGLRQKYRELPLPLKASFWFLICSFFQKGISFITVPIFTRLLSTEEFGNFNVFISWYSIIAVVVSLNLFSGAYTQALVKFNEEDKRPFTSSMQFLTLIMVLLWTGIYLIFRNFFNELFTLDTIQMICLLLMVWTSAILSFWAAEQRVMFRYKELVILTCIVSFLKPIVGVLMVLNSENKVLARIIGLVIVEFICYIPLFIVHIKRGKKLCSLKYWAYALSFNIPLVPHYLSQIVLNSADKIMIERMVGSSEAGLYSLAYSLANIMLLFNGALLQTLNPWIYQKIKDNNERDITRVAYISLIFIGVVNLLLIIMAPEAIKLLGPESYQQSVWVIPPIAMSLFFIYSYSLFAAFEFYYKKTIFIMVASIIASATNVVLNYIFIKRFGYIAAGYTTLICYIIYAVAHYLAMIRICKREGKSNIYNTGYILAISITFLGFGFLLMSMYNYTFIRYIIVLVIMIICLIMRKKIKAIFLFLIKH